MFSEAYLNGYRDFHQYVEFDNNRYEPGSDRYRDWVNGWLRAELDDSEDKIDVDILSPACDMEEIVE